MFHIGCDTIPSDSRYIVIVAEKNKVKQQRLVVLNVTVHI